MSPPPPLNVVELSKAYKWPYSGTALNSALADKVHRRIYIFSYTMAKSRRQNRFSTRSNASSSSSTSPERGADDDNDSIMQHANDSQSSLAVSDSPDATTDEAQRQLEERCRVSPICRLPAELMIQIFAKLSSAMDLKNCMLVSKDWARNSVGILWHRPQTNKWQSLRIVAKTVHKTNGYFDYSTFVKRLNLSVLLGEVSDGTLDPFIKCKRIERLTLTNCTSLTDLSVVGMIEGNRSLLALDVTGIQGVSDQTMVAVAKNCLRLQGLNITGCRKIGDEALEAVARSCRYLKRVSWRRPFRSMLLAILTARTAEIQQLPTAYGQIHH